MEGDSDAAVKSSGGVVTKSVTNESAPMIKNANVRVDNHLELFYDCLLLLTQYAMLLSVIHLNYQGKKESLYEAHAFSMISFVCSFMVFGLTAVLLFVDHYVTIFTSKSGALYTMRVWRLSSYAAHLWLDVILIKDGQLAELAELFRW